MNGIGEEAPSRQFRERVQKTWRMLTEDDLDEIERSPEQLSAILQKRYCCEKEQAERDVSAFCNRHGPLSRVWFRVES